MKKQLLTGSIVGLTICVSILLGVVIGANLQRDNRYYIVSNNSEMILLDKRTGLTWRQNKAVDLRSTWSEMNFYSKDFGTMLKMNAPIGKTKDKNKALKETKKYYFGELTTLIEKNNIKDYKSFAKAVKETYPEYKDIEDKELVEKICKRYPDIKKVIEVE